MNNEYDSFFNVLLENEKYVSAIKDCYDYKTMTCDGSCQGASGCRMAEWLRGTQKEKPTNLEMIKRYYIGQQYHCHMEKTIKKLSSNPGYKKKLNRADVVVENKSVETTKEKSLILYEKIMKMNPSELSEFLDKVREDGEKCILASDCEVCEAEYCSLVSFKDFLSFKVD